MTTGNDHTGGTLPALGWETRVQDWRGVVERQLRFGKRRAPPITRKRFDTETDARVHAAELRARNPHPDYLVAVVPLGRPVAAPAPAFDGAETYPWSGRRPA
jgi:hypothetical protein